jgi:hypothetical protein
MPRGTRADKEAKRRAVAKGVAEGKSATAIAKEAGCKRRHVERLKQEPETQLLITEMLRPHRRKLEKLVEGALAVVGAGLKAKVGTRVDHEIRLRSVGRVKQLLELAQGGQVEKPSEGAGLVTWEEFVVLYRKKVEGAAA